MIEKITDLTQKLENSQQKPFYLLPEFTGT